jgi:peptidylprolyl isomerase
VHYTSVSWATSSVSSSTWDSGTPASGALDELPEGFDEALAGATVGSQVVTVVPGDDGAATVSVIDILGVDKP